MKHKITKKQLRTDVRDVVDRWIAQARATLILANGGATEHAGGYTFERLRMPDGQPLTISTDAPASTWGYWAGHFMERVQDSLYCPE